MHAITLENLNYYLNYFNKLKKANLEFEINKTEKYVAGEGTNSAYYQIGFYATFKNVSTLRALADIWTAAPNMIQLDAIQGYKGLDAMTKEANCTKVNGDLYRKNVPGVKFYAASVFDNNTRVNLYLLDKAVPEKADGTGHTIRSCIHGGIYSGGQLVLCTDEQSPYYNYVDQGHVICYVSTGDSMEDGNRMFITDAITLDMNYIIAAASIYPAAIDEILQHKAFIPSKDCRLQLLKMEKAIPAKLRSQYIELKTRIQEDFSKNTANVMIGKLKRAESPFIDLNGIRMTATRAEYTAGHVSIEAKNLADVVFSKLNPNEAEWDIFTLINIYTDWVNEQFKGLTLNADETGFTEAKNFSFKINDIPLKVSCSTENTRRSINGHLINVDELSPVLRRASCYQQVEGDPAGSNIQNFDKFISNVSRHSLKTRDIWANGLPVKTVFFETDKNSYGKPATLKHPKLRFVHKDAVKNSKGFYLVVNIYDPKDKQKVLATHEYRIGKFAEFIKKVENLNRESYMGYQGDYQQTKEGFFVPKNTAAGGNNCGAKLAELLTIYADGITDEDKKNIVGVINYELSEAEKRSEELLKEACELTGAKASTRDGKAGYVVKGKIRNYFVETEGANKVWEHHDDKTGQYVCIVNRGEMGVGRDALVARLFALSNDEMMAKQIHTLKKH